MEYKKITVGNYDPKGSWKRTDPFTTAFCRTLLHGNIMIVGGYHEVIKKLTSLGPALTVTSLWWKGFPRTTGPHLLNCTGKYYLFHEHKDRKWHLYQRGLESELAIWGKVPSSFPRILRERELAFLGKKGR